MCFHHKFIMNFCLHKFVSATKTVSSLLKDTCTRRSPLQGGQLVQVVARRFSVILLSKLLINPTLRQRYCPSYKKLTEFRVEEKRESFVSATHVICLKLLEAYVIRSTVCYLLTCQITHCVAGTCPGCAESCPCPYGYHSHRYTPCQLWEETDLLRWTWW